jgi:alpha,alpha-trehalase
MYLLLLFFQFSIVQLLFSQQPAPPDKIYGELFHEVQMKRIFSDGKTFVDCTPKGTPKSIMAEYTTNKNKSTFDLEKFVYDNFALPVNPATNYQTDTTEDIVSHIKKLWKVLYRPADSAITGELHVEAGSSLLPLPYSYIVPGGRFREIYYWDSYFTMLGLRESGEFEMIENMVRNFAYLIHKYGHIPNGNRTYYLGRSQPPFFAAMVNLLADIKGDSIYKSYLPALEKEYKYWMQGSTAIKPGQAFRRAVKLKDGTVLNRYWDDIPDPRQESYREDFETASAVIRSLQKTSGQSSKYKKPKRQDVYRHLRAGAESGIDFSSRWFRDKKNLITIHTTDFIPPDLNALLYNLEMTISKAKSKSGDENSSNEFRRKAVQRQRGIQKYCYKEASGFYYDYDFIRQQRNTSVTPAGMYPFFFFERDYDKSTIQKMVNTLKSSLLRAGGISTSVYNTGEQWDEPNGWPPLQWMTIGALEKVGEKELAKEIAQRWIKLNIRVYKETGKLMEKYDVTNINRLAGGGEYPSQDGFGWTNGVFLKLISMYGLPVEQAHKNPKIKQHPTFVFAE